MEGVVARLIFTHSFGFKLRTSNSSSLFKLVELSNHLKDQQVTNWESRKLLILNS